MNTCLRQQCNARAMPEVPFHSEQVVKVNLILLQTDRT